MENVFEYVWFVKTRSHRAIVRADNARDAIERIDDYLDEPILQVISITELDNDYGVVDLMTVL